MKKFWFCYIPEKGFPSLDHESQAAAIEEAHRLCRKEKTTVFILESTGFVRRKDEPTEYIPNP